MDEIEVIDRCANRLAKYANEINEISFKGFTEREMNMVFALITNMRDRGTRKATFSYIELKKAMGLQNTHITNEEFRQEMLKMKNKLNLLTCSIETKEAYISFVLFPTFIMQKGEDIITLAVNQDFVFLLNSLANYTSFKLEQFVDLNSKYTKTLYRKLCQFRRTGRYMVTVEEFRRLFCVPESYSAKEVMKRVINPGIEELSKVGEEFKDLKCIPHYLKERGNPVGSYEFVWEPKEREYTEEELEGCETI